MNSGGNSEPSSEFCHLVLEFSSARKPDMNSLVSRQRKRVQSVHVALSWNEFGNHQEKPVRIAKPYLLSDFSHGLGRHGICVIGSSIDADAGHISESLSWHQFILLR